MRGRERRGKNAGPGPGHVGVARALSKMGFCSRSEAFERVREGRVRLNGTVVKNPEAAVRLGKDRIEVDGAAVERAEKVYWMLNKPRSLVTTAEDEKERQTVYTAMPKELPWISPVGRLDKASEGLLLFTNDTEWAARITAPESHLEKRYHVQVKGHVGEGLLGELERGVVVDTGEVLRVKSARRIREGEKNLWVEVVLEEGKNRQIRRMLEARGLEVLRLIRVGIGPLQLGDLAKGAARVVSATEKAALDRALRPGPIHQTSAFHTGKSQ